MTVTFSGKIKEDGMGKGGLSAADKAWIAGLIRPIQKDVSEIKERLTNVENRLDIVEQDIKTLKKDVKAIDMDIKVGHFNVSTYTQLYS